MRVPRAGRASAARSRDTPRRSGCAPAVRSDTAPSRSAGAPSESLTSMDSHRPGVTNFVHIGLVVEDLDETVRFLALLGFDCGEPGVFSGEWIDRITGLENVTVEP